MYSGLAILFIIISSLIYVFGQVAYAIAFVLLLFFISIFISRDLAVVSNVSDVRSAKVILLLYVSYWSAGVMATLLAGEFNHDLLKPVILICSFFMVFLFLPSKISLENYDTNYSKFSALVVLSGLLLFILSKVWQSSTGVYVDEYSSIYSNPNSYAQIHLLIFICSFWIFVRNSTLLTFALLIFNTYLMWENQSRALMVSALFSVIIYWLSYWLASKTSKSIILAATIAATITVTIYKFDLISSLILQELRIKYWFIGIIMIINNPLGYGFTANVKELFGMNLHLLPSILESTKDLNAHGPHQSLILAFFQSGWFGGCMYTLIYIILIWKIIKKIFNSCFGFPELLATSYLVYSMFETGTMGGFSPFPFIMTLAFGLVIIGRPTAQKL